VLYTNQNTTLEIFETLKVSPTLDGNFVLLEDFDLMVKTGV
jgi:hypothetical protein